MTIGSSRHCKFEVPEIIFGNGLLDRVGSCARRLGARKVFLVSDRGVFGAGWVDLVMKSLLEAGLSFVYYDQVTSNPKDFEIEQGAREYLAQRADVIIGLGGGSAMDAAKGIAILVSNGGAISEYAGNDRIHRPLPPLVLCPTTCGTGSDVSQFVIVNDTREKCKLTIMSRCVAPDISLTDPETLRTLPDEYVATTAMDALTHAVEAFFSVASSTLTDVNALRALTLLSRSFVKAIRERRQEDMENLSLASLHAGMAFSNSLLGIGHALAHPIGGLYDSNHGSVNAALLPEVLQYDFPVVAEKIPEMASAFGFQVVGDTAGAKATIHESIMKMLEAGGAPGGLRQLGVRREDLPLIAQRALKDICVTTSPRVTDEEDLLALLQRAF